jgi:hypothetical protein
MAARRRVWFLFLWGAAVLVLVGGAGVAWQLQRARHLIRQSLERRHGLQVSVGRVRLAWPPGHLVVEDLKVSTSADVAPLLSVPHLTLVGDVFSIVRGSLTFSRATAQSPRALIPVDRPEELSALLTLLSGSPREREAARSSIKIGPVVILPATFSVVGGRLLLQGRGGAPREWEGVSGRMTRKGGGLHVEITQPEMGRLTADISPVGLGEAEAKIRLSAADLKAVLPPSVALGGPIDLSVTIRGSDRSLAMEGRLSLADGGGEQRGYLLFSFPERAGELFMAGERLPLEVLSGLFIPGQPAIGGRTTYSTQLRWRGLSWPEFRQSLSGSGVVRVDDGWLPARVRAQGSDRPLRYRELAVRFRVSAGRVVTDELEIRGEPWMLRGSGRLDPGGKLTARVASPPGRLPALQGLLSGDLTRPRLTILLGDF